MSLINNNYLGAINPSVLVLASAGTQYLDMNQTGGNSGGITQVVPAALGQQHPLSLDASAWATNAVGASVAYRLYDPLSSAVFQQDSFVASVGGEWTTQTLLATDTSASLGARIQADFSSQAVIGLDNIVLTAVPEPKSYALLMAGLLATGLQLRSQAQAPGRRGAEPAAALRRPFSRPGPGRRRRRQSGAAPWWHRPAR